MHSNPEQPEAVAASIQSISNPLLQELPNQYELIGKISQGGMGSIYKAKHRYTGAFAAIKVIRPEFGRDMNAMLRFKFEAKAAYSLKHPNICTVHDFGVTPGGLPFLVMDWIDGISLARKVAHDGPLTVAEAAAIFLQVTHALAHAHQNKVIHRDLKPENIMLTKDRKGDFVVHVVDFGIAKRMQDENENQTPSDGGLTGTGIIVGTPMYMSPEQARGVQVDMRCDVYSLGCVMYFALSGTAPFNAPTVIDTINMHLNDSPPEFNASLKVPADVRMIILKSMEKSPNDRYQSMEEVAADLEKLTKGVAVERRVLASERKLNRKRLAIAACFIIGFVATYFISILLQMLFDASQKGSKPETERSAPYSANLHKTKPSETKHSGK
jgi:serine/threonine-protein kinase